MSKYQTLLAEREALDRKIKEARQEEIATVLARIRQDCKDFSLTPQDIFGKGQGQAGASESKKVPPKYRNPATGDTWTGRGKAPAWIANLDRTQYLIEPAA